MPISHNPSGCCPEAGLPCSCCEGETRRRAIITISGMANDSCADCVDLNGAWVLEQDSPSVCHWKSVESLPCGLAIDFEIHCEIFESQYHYFYNLRIFTLPASWNANWHTYLATDKPQCLTDPGQLTNYNGQVGDTCDASNATVTVEWE